MSYISLNVGFHNELYTILNSGLTRTDKVFTILFCGISLMTSVSN